jgi:hypothetical protein
VGATCCHCVVLHPIELPYSDAATSPRLTDEGGVIKEVPGGSVTSPSLCLSPVRAGSRATTLRKSHALWRGKPEVSIALARSAVQARERTRSPLRKEKRGGGRVEGLGEPRVPAPTPMPSPMAYGFKLPGGQLRTKEWRTG